MPPRKTWDDYPQPVRDQRTGCLRWQGPHHSQGYGKIGSRQYAHIVAWERVHGPVPDGHELDHVRDRGCEYRDCVEVEHLEAVTHAENVRRSERVQAQLARTHCPQGHEYAGHNLMIKKGRRQCRRCHYDTVTRCKRNARARLRVTDEVP